MIVETLNVVAASAKAYSALDEADQARGRAHDRRRRRERKQAMTAGAVGVGVVGAVAAARLLATANEVGGGSTSIGLRRMVDQVGGFSDRSGLQALEQYRGEAEQLLTTYQSDRSWTRGWRWFSLVTMIAAGVVALVLGHLLAAAGVAAAAVVMLILGGFAPIEPTLPAPPVVFPDAGRKSPARPVLQECVATRGALEQLTWQVAQRDPVIWQMLAEAKYTAEQNLAERAFVYETLRGTCRDAKRDPLLDPECEVAMVELQNAARTYSNVRTAAVTATKATPARATEVISRIAGIQALTSHGM